MSENEYPPNNGQDGEDAAAKDAADEASPLTDAESGALAEEVASLNDKVLRLAAELENTRRRAEREKADASRYAIANFARDLLSVADNFDRALQAAPEGAEVPAEAVSGLVTGVRMTEKELVRTLERHGVVRIDPTGEKFDPNIHQAVAQAPAAGVPSGHVAEVAQTGFILGDRVLRAAMVVVSTGEPAADADHNNESAPGAHIDTSA